MVSLEFMRERKENFYSDKMTCYHAKIRVDEREMKFPVKVKFLLFCQLFLSGSSHEKVRADESEGRFQPG